jgi:hypothetical protein
MLDVRTLPEPFLLFGEKPPPPWGVDGRPADWAVSLVGAAPGEEVLVSRHCVGSDRDREAVVARLRRGEFGGLSEAEATRLMRDRAAAARLAHDRLTLRAHRHAPELGVFVGMHRPYTHHRGDLLVDPYCVLCGVGYGDLLAPFFPCPLVLRAMVVHGLRVD